MITEGRAIQIEHGLDRIFDLLTAGELSSLTDALSALEDQLGAPQPDGPLVGEARLAALRRKADRNAACLKGAARGLRAARRRVAEVRSAATGIGAYDVHGQRLDPTLAGGRINRRF